MALKKWLLLPFGSSGAQGPGPGGRLDAKANHQNKGDTATSKEDKVAEYAQKDEEDAVEDVNAPIRWWFVSTLFPLIAGTFGPMASAFNICAVAIDWRTTVASSSTESEGRHIPDPRWLVAVNGVSLAIAIISNFALLGHMTERIRFSVAAPIVVVGWYISSFVLIGLVAAAPTHLPLPTDTPATFSQAYYYACFAASIYLLLSIMLTVTAGGVFLKHLSSDFKLTMSQRSLMLQTMMFLGYLLAAAAVYCRIEGWDFLDAVYFVNVTLFTIGFGEWTPKTHLGRGLFFPMAVGGILFVGLIIASVRTLVLESSSRKISARMVEKARHKALQKGDPASGVIKLRGLQTHEVGKGSSSELARREQEFKIMREVQRQAAHDNRMIALAISGGAFFILWIVGAIVFWQAEKAIGGQNWSYFEALYFTYVSLLTIGYGDFYPQTNSAKPAFVFWSLIALPTLTVLIGSVGDVVSDFVAAAILWLGKNTPEWGSALKGLKGTANKKKKREGAFDEAKPPGFMSDGQAERGDFDDQAQADAVQGLGDDLQDNAEDRESKDRREAQAAGWAYRPYLIMKEMKNVVQHLDASPPRKYTFEEWTWLLKLINEDEANPEGHRIPGQHVDEQHPVAAPLKEDPKQVWSWMGQESPLMSTEDEPKWVLQRLMVVLERELKSRGDQHMDNEHDQQAK